MALSDARIAARLPACDLQWAHRWYAEKLGLKPTEERPGGLRYAVGGAEFAIYRPRDAPTGPSLSSPSPWRNIEADVTALKARGVVFEDYDIPGLETVEGIAEIDGNHPSEGSGERAAWFRDSEGNMLVWGSRPTDRTGRTSRVRHPHMSAGHVIPGPDADFAEPAGMAQ